MSGLVWPERPTCHDAAPRYTDGPVLWRPPRENDEYMRGERFRTCGYCGSIHPEDLYGYLKDVPPFDEAEEGEKLRSAGLAGSSYFAALHEIKSKRGPYLSGSDWKYGWPHKFYVNAVPNPHAGKPARVGTRTKVDEDGRVMYGPDGVALDDLIMGTASPFVHAKWYNAHLRDEGYSPEAWQALADLLELHSGVLFVLDGDRLKYRAPYGGYQR